MADEVESTKTLKEICQLLQVNFKEYFQCSDQFFESRSVRVANSRNGKALSSPLKSEACFVHNKSTSTEAAGQEKQTEGKRSAKYLDDGAQEFRTSQNASSTPSEASTISPSKNTENTDARFGFTTQQNLNLMRENIELKIRFEELQKIVKHGPRGHEATDHLIRTIKEILSKVLHVQKRSEILCDQLCDGLCKTKESFGQMPSELQDFCAQLSTNIDRSDFCKIGHELHIDEDIIKSIESEYDEDAVCLQQIIFEWLNKNDDPSYHEFLSACHKINPTFLECKLLSYCKVKVLEKCYSKLCDDILDVPLLPHLISAGVMSFRLQQYVLQPKTTDQRLARLINILCTKENGFDELLKALDATDQHHVSAYLINTLEKMTEPNLDVQHEYQETKGLTESLNLTKYRKRYVSEESLFDDLKSIDSAIATSSGHSCSATLTLDTLAALKEIHRMISKVLRLSN